MLYIINFSCFLFRIFRFTFIVQQIKVDLFVCNIIFIFNNIFNILYLQFVFKYLLIFMINSLMV